MFVQSSTISSQNNEICWNFEDFIKNETNLDSSAAEDYANGDKDADTAGELSIQEISEALSENTNDDSYDDAEDNENDSAEESKLPPTKTHALQAIDTLRHFAMTREETEQNLFDFLDQHERFVLKCKVIDKKQTSIKDFFKA